jgi:LPXTG-motif cell wall-anchored protein
MRTINRLLVAAAAIAAPLAIATTAGAALPEPSLIVPVSVEVGETFVVGGAGFCPGVEVVLTLDTDPETTLATVLTDGGDVGSGGFAVEVTAPATPGSFTLTATDGECSLTASAPLVITTPEATTTTVEPTTTVAETTTTVAETTTTIVEPIAPVPTTTMAPVTELPATGNSDGRIAVAALLALLAGTGLIAATRRTRTN